LNLDNVLYNCYGPTEASIDATFWRCQRGNNYILAPIGCPITNTQIYILDEDLQPVPVGESGELYIGGAGLARGYLNRPDLTREKFILNPFSQEPGARLYKTGDLARYLGDGNIEYIGRLDSQIKIRGFRVELGEVEAVLSQHPAVQQSVVIAREDVPGDKRLVAYVILNSEQVAIIDKLRHFLKQRLPDYMVPSAFVMLEALPMTPNGKVDRRSLPEPPQTRQETEAIVVPRDEAELQLANIWEKVLGIQPIGIRDNFFDLGGNSLLALRLVAQVEKAFKKNLPLATFFQNPTIEQLAKILCQSGLPKSLSYLVPIQPNGSKPPLFLCQGVSLYQPLISYLGLEQPVYGLIAEDGQGRPVYLNRIEELAAHYIEEIKTLQPEGPYLLGGLSFGGVIAFEVAQQLVSQGDQVALLALFDSCLPGAQKVLPMPIYKRLLHHLNQILQIGPNYLLEMLKRKMNISYGKIAFKNNFFRIKNLEYLIRREAYNQGVKKYSINYVPQVYPDRVTLFKAIDRDITNVEVVEVEPGLGWTKLAAGGLEIHEIPGDHHGILKEPNVQLLAEKLKLSIDERTK
jgi:thioesterase domain-containing protein/acyl carrier protein